MYSLISDKKVGRSLIHEIEAVPYVQSIKIKKVFFTFGYYGHTIDVDSQWIPFKFRMNKRGFQFQGSSFSGDWLRRQSNSWTDSLPGCLVNSNGEELVKSCTIERNEERGSLVVSRRLFRIITRTNEYLLWCLAELYPFFENPHKLLVLSDSVNNVIIRGRTESFRKEFQVLFDHTDLPVLLPVYFNYYVLPPIRNG